MIYVGCLSSLMRAGHMESLLIFTQKHTFF